MVYFKNNEKLLGDFKQGCDMTGFSFLKNSSGWAEKIVDRQGESKDSSLEMSTTFQKRASHGLDQDRVNGGGRDAWILILL